MYFAKAATPRRKAWSAPGHRVLLDAGIERITTFAYNRAENRSRRLCSVDKANVLNSSQLWPHRHAMSTVFPSVKLEHMYVDNAAMH